MSSHARKVLGCWGLVHSQEQNSNNKGKQAYKKKKKQTTPQNPPQNPPRLQVTMKQSRNVRRCIYSKIINKYSEPNLWFIARAFSSSGTVTHIADPVFKELSHTFPKLISHCRAQERRWFHSSDFNSICSKSIIAKPCTLLAGHLPVPMRHVCFVFI